MSGSTATVGTTSFEVKQLEQQNTRLRETLVRMRDLSAHEKHEFQKLQKDLEQKKSEILELSKTKEKLSARVEEMEHQISDLQEQVTCFYIIFCINMKVQYSLKCQFTRSMQL
jgi:dynactin 1